MDIQLVTSNLTIFLLRVVHERTVHRLLSRDSVIMLPLTFDCLSWVCHKDTGVLAVGFCFRCSRLEDNLCLTNCSVESVFYQFSGGSCNQVPLLKLDQL